MKLSRALILSLLILVPQLGAAQTRSAAQRAWGPFFTSFRAAVKRRDPDALSKMMSKDFYYLSSGGDENGNQDSRDEAFEYWKSSGVGAWEALDKVLAQGTVPNTTVREPGSVLPSRIAPPAANKKGALTHKGFGWYAVFEFRDGRWYCTAFVECCE
jgi:hypothetical protein